MPTMLSLISSRLSTTTLLKVIFSAFIIYRVFMLDIFPFSTNDSITYLTNATSDVFLREPLKIVQPRGYKFAGYPIFLSTTKHIGAYFPLSPMTFMALFQRLLLAAALILLVFSLGIFSVPLALFLSSGQFLAQANILATEGMTVPFAVFYSLAMLKMYDLRNENGARKTPEFYLLFAALLISFSFLVLTKLTYILFGIPLIAVAFNFKGSLLSPRIRPTAVAPFVLFILGVYAAYAGAIAFDNYKTFDRFTLVIGQERIAYWGAWQQTFVENPANRTRPDLRKFYNQNSPYAFLRDVETKAGGMGNFKATAPAIAAETKRLLKQSNMSVSGERTKVFFLGVLGGTKTELSTIRSQILSANGQEYNAATWNKNVYSEKYGLNKFLSAFNQGSAPQRISGFHKSAIISKHEYRIYQAVFTLIVLGVGFFLVITKKIGLMSVSIATLVAYLLFVGTLALYFVDVWRYIITGWTLLMVVLFHAFKESSETGAK